jgi:hypothetical protein
MSTSQGLSRDCWRFEETHTGYINRLDYASTALEMPEQWSFLTATCQTTDGSELEERSGLKASTPHDLLRRNVFKDIVSFTRESTRNVETLHHMIDMI